MAKLDDSRSPVIVGVGQRNDRPAVPAEGHDPMELMQRALEAADADAGGGWLSQLDSLALVDQISFPDLGDASAPLAERIGARPPLCYKTQIASGDSPILLLHEAANRIGAGEIEVAAVVGAEALRTAAARAAAAAGDDPKAHNRSRELSTKRAPAYRQRYGLVAPVDVYPLYENAGRAAFGQSLAEAQEESSQIWSRFSEVAAENPGAWLRESVSAEEIRTPSAKNRPIAFPYNKLMVANSSVNQGAGFLVTSLARARAARVPDDRVIHVGLGAAAHEDHDFLARDQYVSSPGMEVSLRQTLELNGLTTRDLDAVELYSCFPCVPKMARRVIDWPVSKPASVVGGLTFGGGPIGNYMSHAVVCMVEKLRKQGRYGLLFANGGFATHNHSIVLSREAIAAARFPQNFDYQAKADAKRGATPVITEDYAGPGTIETYTVLYNRSGEPRFGAIVARTPSGERFLAKLPASDEAGIAFLTSGAEEPVGTEGKAIASRDGDRIWTR